MKEDRKNFIQNELYPAYSSMIGEFPTSIIIHYLLKYEKILSAEGWDRFYSIDNTRKLRLFLGPSNRFLKFGFNLREILNESKIVNKKQSYQDDIRSNCSRYRYPVYNSCDFVSDIEIYDDRDNIDYIFLCSNQKILLKFEKQGKIWRTNKFRPPYSPLPLIFLRDHRITIDIFYKKKDEQNSRLRYKRYDYKGGQIPKCPMISIFDDTQYMVMINGMFDSIVEKRFFEKIK